MSVCEDHLSCTYALFWVGLIWLIIIPFEIYATSNIFKYRYHPGLQSRYPMLVMASAIFAMLHSLICEQFYYLSSGVNIYIFHAARIPYITHIFPLIFLIIMIIISFRIYMIHYSINYAVAQSARKWQSLLSTSVANDFYSRHQSTYGNYKHVFRCFIVYGIIGCSVHVCISIWEHSKGVETSHTISHMLYMFFNLTLVVFDIFLFLKTPKFEDVYFLRKEMKYLLYFGTFCLILYSTMISLISEEYRIFEQISTSAITVFNFGHVVISEYIVLYQIKRTNELESGFDYDVLKTHMFQNTLSLVRSQLRKKRASSSRQLFNVLIASPVGINYFVRHLQSEFSMENLLCFIELIQWIYNVTNKEFAIFDITPFSNIDFELSSAIPISSANERVRINANQWDWTHAISIIFKKYIHPSAHYQVNLPYHIQMEFTHLIHLLNIKQQTTNGTYTFKHQPDIKHFWSRKRTMNQTTISDINRCRAKSHNITHTHTMHKQKELFPHSSAPDPIVKKEIDDEQIGNEGYTNDSDNECAEDIYHKHGLEVIDEVVMLDEDAYEDPEIDLEDISCASSTKTTDIENIDNVIDLHLDNMYKTSTFSVIAHSLGTSLRNISVDEEYLKELQMIEEAKNLTSFGFVCVSCRVLHVILLLNYQSIKRFKRSHHYTNMLDAINLEQLIHKYGEKGVS